MLETKPQNAVSIIECDMNVSETLALIWTYWNRSHLNHSLFHDCNQLFYPSGGLCSADWLRWAYSTSAKASWRRRGETFKLFVPIVVIFIFRLFLRWCLLKTPHPRGWVALTWACGQKGFFPRRNIAPWTDVGRRGQLHGPSPEAEGD